VIESALVQTSVFFVLIHPFLNCVCLRDMSVNQEVKWSTLWMGLVSWPTVNSTVNCKISLCI